jgi:hypothetical protein
MPSHLLPDLAATLTRPPSTLGYFANNLYQHADFGPYVHAHFVMEGILKAIMSEANTYRMTETGCGWSGRSTNHLRMVQDCPQEPNENQPRKGNPMVYSSHVTTTKAGAGRLMEFIAQVETGPPSETFVGRWHEGRTNVNYFVPDGLRPGEDEACGRQALELCCERANTERELIGWWCDVEQITPEFGENAKPRVRVAINWWFRYPLPSLELLTEEFLRYSLWAPNKLGRMGLPAQFSPTGRPQREKHSWKDSKGGLPQWDASPFGYTERYERPYGFKLRECGFHRPLGEAFFPPWDGLAYTEGAECGEQIMRGVKAYARLRVLQQAQDHAHESLFGYEREDIWKRLTEFVTDNLLRVSRRMAGDSGSTPCQKMEWHMLSHIRNSALLHAYRTMLDELQVANVGAQDHGHCPMDEAPRSVPLAGMEAMRAASRYGGRGFGFLVYNDCVDFGSKFFAEQGERDEEEVSNEAS